MSDLGNADDDDFMDRIFDIVRETLPEDGMADTVTVEPIVKKLIHVACHLAVAGRIKSPDYVKIAMEEYLDASRCVMAQLADEMLARVFSGDAILPEDDDGGEKDKN